MASKNPLKMIKNAFYFTLRTFFVFKKFKFLALIIGHLEKELVEKISLISKLIMLRSAKQTIAIDILSTISRIKQNQAIKFRQLIDYNTKTFS